MEKNKNNNENIFIKKYPLIFRKYHPLKKIADGAFSEIFYGVNDHTKEKVAIKIESRYVVNKLLESECFLLFSLKGVGIPKVLSYGHNKEYDILIMPLLGKSLKELYISKNLNFEFKDVCLIAIQIIERIKFVHSKKIIHRDIKPDNFLIGLNDPNIIYLIDFGLSKKYKSSTTGKHIKFTELKKFTGTILYASVNALRFKEQSRRDDLESIGYMLIHLMKGSLPWQRIKVNNKKESYLKISEIKKHINPEKLCENLPGEMIDYINYVRKLQFEESPDYNYLGNLFQTMLKKAGYDPDNIYFSWIDENSIKRLKKPVNYSKRSSCSRERIINKIKKSLDVKRSLSDHKNIWKENTDYNMKIKRYIDEKVINNMKYCDQKIHSGGKNENKHIEYVNNAINNNYITISVSITNNTPENSTFLKNENKNILLNSVSSMKKLHNNIIPLSQKPSDSNLFRKNECNQNIKNIEKSSTTFKKYQQYNPNFLVNKENTDIIPLIDCDINTNPNLIFYNKKYKNRNRKGNDISYNQVISFNSYNKKFSSVNNLPKDKTLYKTNKNNYYNTTNNSNGNLNEPKKYEISYNTNINNKKNSDMNNYPNYNKINNNIIYNNYNNFNYSKQNDLNSNNINISYKINNRNKNNIKMMSNICNSYNLSYSNLTDMKNKITKSQKESTKNEHKFKNLYNRNLKIKLFNISPFKKISSNNIQKKNSQSVTNNNELMKELKTFNLRYNYNYENGAKYGEEKWKQNKTKRIIRKKLSQVNQSADHNKMLNLKNKINRVKQRNNNNNENNCFIF